ncbi:MAG: transposase, partial [Candidatus Thermoplasmatota archaeon]|nr:transposase [Candidatus Thermoplasmatota archaeon]
KGLHTSLHNTGIIGRFIGLLTYKATLCGKRVRVISEQDTSKTCCVCGHKKNRMPLYQRTYHCEKCGNTLDRDVNSTVNIMLRFLSQNALWTRYQQFVDTLRQTVVGYAERPTPIYSKEAPFSTVQSVVL